MRKKKSPEFERERLLCSALLSSFPDEVAQEIRRIKHRDDLRHHVALEVEQCVERRAQLHGLVCDIEDELFGTRRCKLLAVHRDDILAKLAREPQFIAWLHKRVDAALRTAHQAKIDPHQVTSLPVHIEVEPPVEGATWRPECDLGLGTATVLDEAPDAFWLWVASTIAAESKCRADRGLNARQNVLHLDPRGGPLARALCTTDLPAGLKVQELGPELSATRVTAPKVGQDRQAAIRLESFDFLAWSVPSPALGAASSQGGIYDHAGVVEFNDGRQHIEVPWLGKLGPTRWRGIFDALLRGLLPAVLAPGGSAIIRVPLGVRVQQRAREGQPARNGYEPRPNLLEGLLDGVEQVGLNLVRAYDAEDRHPVPQPFVSRSRPRSRIIFLRRSEVVQ